MRPIGKNIGLPICNFDHSDPSASSSELPAGKHLGPNKPGPYDHTFNRKMNGSNIVILSPRQWDSQAEELKSALVNGYKYLRDGFAEYFKLDNISVEKYSFEEKTFEQYLDLAERLEDQDYDLVIFLVSNRMERMKYSPYSAAKLHLIDNAIPTQMVKKETIEDSRTFKNSIVNIGIQIYAKLGGTPWVLNDTASDAKFILGVGKSEEQNTRIGTRKRTIGFTTLLQDDGRFRHFNSTSKCASREELQEQLEETIFDTISEFGDELTEDDLVVVHNYKRIGKGEKEAAKSLEKKYGINIALLHINNDSNFEMFDPETHTGAANCGTILRTASSQALLYTDGQERINVTGTVSTRPLWINGKGHTDDFYQTVRDIHYLCYVYWCNQFGATEPITMKYSKAIADMIETARGLSKQSKLDIDPSKLGHNGHMRKIPWFI